MEQKEKIFFPLLGALLLSTSLLMIWDDWNWDRRKTHEISAMQQALGGLGMGAISGPAWNFINYDPRISPVDDALTWPIPGGFSAGPDRTASITYFEENPQNEWMAIKKKK